MTPTYEKPKPILVIETTQSYFGIEGGSCPPLKYVHPIAGGRSYCL
jgi:hypothetical protein